MGTGGYSEDGLRYQDPRNDKRLCGYGWAVSAEQAINQYKYRTKIRTGIWDLGQENTLEKRLYAEEDNQ